MIFFPPFSSFATSPAFRTRKSFAPVLVIHRRRQHVFISQTKSVSVHTGMLYLQSQIKQVIIYILNIYSPNIHLIILMFVLSSSRFTDSKKYETDFIDCFQLITPRQGEICNACVLLVKRFKRLPPDSDRHWGHVSLFFFILSFLCRREKKCRIIKYIHNKYRWSMLVSDPVSSR